MHVANQCKFFAYFAPDCFEKKVVSSERREGRHIDNVMFRSCENMTKYLTGYGHGWGYIVSGEVCRVLC